MRFEWDDAKARSNVQRHGVDFADAATAFDDPRALTMVDPQAVSEERYRPSAAATRSPEQQVRR